MANKSHDADVSFIKALAELLNDNDLTELQVKRDYGENDSLNVRVSRAVMAAPVAPVAVQAPVAAPAAAARRIASGPESMAFIATAIGVVSVAAVLGFVLCFTEIDGDRKINVSKSLLLRG